MNRRNLKPRIEAVLDAAPFALLVLFSAFLYRRFAAGPVPSTGDHLCHMFKGMLMADHLIPSGRIGGWSHMAFAGYPAGLYYPVGGDLVMSLFRYATFGLLDWESVYGLTLFFVLVLAPVSVYLLTRQAAGPVGALVAGLLAAGDLGGWRQGGYIFTVYWGVWPYALSVGISLIAVRMIEPALAGRLSSRPFAAITLAALLALAVMTHPISAMFLAAAVPIFAVSFAIAGRESVRAVAARLAAVGGLAALLALFWLLPQAVGARELTSSHGEAWLSLGKMLKMLARNALFDRFSWIAWALGLCGIALSAISKRLWPTYLAVLLVALFVFSGLGGESFSEKVQAERLSAFMKGIWFALCGVAVDRIGALARLFATRKAGRTGWSERLGAAARPAGRIAGLVLAICIVAIEWGDRFQTVSSVREMDRNLWTSAVEADLWIARQPRGPLDRVLYQPGKLCDKGDALSRDCRKAYDSHLFASGPIRTGRPKIKFGFEPSEVFANIPLLNHWPEDAAIAARFQADPAALVNLGIRWIVSLVPWSDRDDLKEKARFGQVRIYEVFGSDKGPVRMQGQGRVELVRWSDEEIVVKVTGAGPGSRLEFPIAFHSWWSAEHDGKPLEIETGEIAGGLRRILVRLPAIDGSTALIFSRPIYYRIAGAMSGLAWLFCAGWAVAAAVRRRRA